MTIELHQRTRRRASFKPWGSSYIRTGAQHRNLSRSIDLKGVPQIPEDCFIDLFRVGLLTEEQERRCGVAITAACREIRRRIFEAWGVGECFEELQEEDVA